MTTDFSTAGLIDRASYNLLKERLAYYEQLPTEPLGVIADQVPAFKENYDKDRLFLAGWILSRKTFKEAAMKCGAMCGKPSEQIHAEGMSNNATILEGTSAYGNNRQSLTEHVRQKWREPLDDGVQSVNRDGRKRKSPLYAGFFVVQRRDPAARGFGASGKSDIKALMLARITVFRVASMSLVEALFG